MRGKYYSRKALIPGVDIWYGSGETKVKKIDTRKNPKLVLDEDLDTFSYLYFQFTNRINYNNVLLSIANIEI